MDAQRRQLTIVYADLGGCIDNTVESAVARAKLADLRDRLALHIRDAGGSIDSRVEDAMVGLFGVPTARESDAERAVRAALDLCGEEPAVRVGVDTGDAVVGSLTELTFAVTGPALNRARELAGKATNAQPLISNDTYRQALGIFDTTEIAPGVYQVSGIRRRAFKRVAHVVAGVETPLIGRDSELETLCEEFIMMLDTASTRMVTIAGEPGVGKSRLLWEFEDWLDLQRRQVWLFKGRVTDESAASPYGLFRDLFNFRFEIQNDDSPHTARLKLIEGVEATTGGDLADVHFIGELLSFNFSSSHDIENLLDDPKQIRDRAFRSVTRFFSAATERLPAVMLLENVHWADDGSLDLLEHLIESADVNMLVVCVTRPQLLERRPRLRGDDDPSRSTRVVPLHPLSDDQAEALITKILYRVPDIPRELIDQIVDTAEGNPHFIEELVLMLTEDGVIEPAKGGWIVHTDELLTLRVPSTLAVLIQSRLDTLPPAERAILERAAVIGRTFWGSALRAVGEEDDVDKLALESLMNKQFIATRQHPILGETAYFFRHSLMREVTYKSILLRVRRGYHARAARWFESFEDPERFAAAIAEHWERARQPLLAGRWAASAGMRAKASYAARDAIRWDRQALTLLPKGAEHGPQRLRVLTRLGDTLCQQARLDDALDIYAQLTQEAEALGEPRAMIRALLGLAQAHEFRNALTDSLAAAKRAAELAGVEASSLLVECEQRQGHLGLRLGEAAGARRHAERALELSTRLGERRYISGSLFLLGQVELSSGNYRDHVRYTNQALAIFRELGNRVQVANALRTLGEASRLLGDYSKAVEQVREAAEIDRDVGDTAGELAALSNLGGARVGLGDGIGAEEVLREVIGRAPPRWVGLAECHRFLAEALLLRGRLSPAVTAATQAYEMATRGGNQQVLVSIWRVLGELADEIEDSIEVAEQKRSSGDCFAEGLELAERSGMQGEKARLLRSWARHQVHRGERDQANERWNEARTLFEELGMHVEVARMGERAPDPRSLRPRDG